MQRYELDPSLAFETFNKTMNSSNALSCAVFEVLDLKKHGRFFTFLPNGTDVQRIYDFACGGIAHGSKDRTVKLLMEKLASHPKFCLIFDDVLEDYTSLCGYKLFDEKGIHYNNEAYYLMRSNEETNLSLIYPRKFKSWQQELE